MSVTLDAIARQDWTDDETVIRAGRGLGVVIMTRPAPDRAIVSLGVGAGVLPDAHRFRVDAPIRPETHGAVCLPPCIQRDPYVRR